MVPPRFANLDDVMLLELRKVTRGVFATLILGAIAVAMVLFLIPTIGSQGGLNQYVAKVGSAEISPADLGRELDAALQQARDNGRNISREEAIDHNAHIQLLDAMIGRTAVFEYAKRLGVEASDAQIARTIRDMPGLRNPITGRFDANVLDEILSRRHMTRAVRTPPRPLPSGRASRFTQPKSSNRSSSTLRPSRTTCSAQP